eukprot:TRINITY_DN165509_c0_g1_i1.p1 TRINITY_DN165509_c0_g1~~TRINITY_DN165509_c0_g1_i1.p1  ORF type:complete len:465 (-),score=49.89 TRINITY_DN165509_c0_g1_i1:194-1588(-)
MFGIQRKELLCSISPLKIILRCAILSRVVVLAILGLCHALFPHHHDWSDIEFSFNPYLRGFANWDGLHFLGIVQNGYNRETSFAFFPGLPKCIEFMSKVLQSCGMMSQTAILLAGVLISNISFILAAVVLFKLSQKIFGRNSKIPSISTLLFCINPASVFFTAIYSESLFALLSFLVMYMWASKRGILGVLFTTLACFFRSNGVVLGGFACFHLLTTCKWRYQSYWKSAGQLLLCLVGMSIIFSPFVAFEKFCQKRICQWFDYDFCDNLFVNVYSFVQVKHWNVGFLKFYELKQIPNFILASPMILLFVCCFIWCLKRFARNFVSAALNYLTHSNFGSALEMLSFPTTKTATRKISPSEDVPDFLLNRSTLQFVFPHLIYWFVLCIVAVFFMHVQVMTRFICCSSPIFYWICAHMLVRQRKSNSQGDLSLLERVFEFLCSHLHHYFIGYCVCGTVLFSVFLPFV